MMRQLHPLTVWLFPIDDSANSWIEGRKEYAGTAGSRWQRTHIIIDRLQNRIHKDVPILDIGEGVDLEFTHCWILELKVDTHIVWQVL